MLFPLGQPIDIIINALYQAAPISSGFFSGMIFLDSKLGQHQKILDKPCHLIDLFEA